jgi:hypothetical protein
MGGQESRDLLPFLVNKSLVFHFASISLWQAAQRISHTGVEPLNLQKESTDFVFLADKSQVPANLLLVFVSAPAKGQRAAHVLTDIDHFDQFQPEKVHVG